MYVVHPDPTSLRQGDILRNVLLPRYSLASLGLVYKLAKGAEHQFDNRAIVGTKASLAVVVSQCCEFNEGKRSAFGVAEVVPAASVGEWRLPVWGINLAELWPVTNLVERRTPNLVQEKIEILRRANRIDLDDRTENAALHHFLFEPDGAVLETAVVADFSRITSIRMDDVDQLRAAKVLELDDETRDQFRLKLGYYFSRSA